MPDFFALVLTARPGAGHLSESIANRAAKVVPGAQGVRWLSPGDACEIVFGRYPAFDLVQVKAACREVLVEVAIDVNLVAADASLRRKALLCADMESTIIEQELIDEMAGLVGCRDDMEALTRATMRGEINFETSLERRVALFSGLEVERVMPLLGHVTTMPGAETLLGTMRKHGAKCALISGGFTLFANQIGARLGFDAVVANTLEMEGGRFTGRVAKPIVGPLGKAEALRRLSAQFDVEPRMAVGVGDGANDVEMLKAAGLGVAFRAKPILEAAAHSSDTGAVLRHGDLSALLYLQGYAREDFTR